MTDTLRLLHIEDVLADHLLIVRNLRQHGVHAEFHRVDNPLDLTAALAQGGWDAILSDYSLPGMTFRAALAQVRKAEPDLPVILVSGSIGEEEALDLLRVGLSDFVLKDRPTRLAGALHHAMEEARILRAKRATEAALTESEARLAILFRLSPMAIGVSRAVDGRLVELNEALLEIFGHTREEALGLTTIELGLFVDPGDRDRLMAEVQRAGRARNFQFQGRRKDGRLCDLLLSLDRIQIGGEDFYLGMCSDITSVKESERSLVESERQFRSLFVNMAEGVAHCRMMFQDGEAVDWEYLATNPAYTQATGFQNVVGRRVSEVMPSLRADHPELFKRLEMVVWTGNPAKFDIYLKPVKQWMSVSAYRPAPGEFVVVLDNITERKQTVDALQASESRFVSVFQASPGGIMLSNLKDGRIVEANPAFLRMVDFQLGEVLGQTSFDLGLWVHPQDRESAIQELRTTGQVREREVDLVTRKGRIVSVLWSTELIQQGDQILMVNLIQDQTERKHAERERRRLEAELAHSEKLDSLGVLAGSVSHDMNNVLAAIMTVASTLQTTHADDPKVAKAMESLLYAAGRGKALVKGLADFARKDLQEAKPVDLGQVARSEVSLLGRATTQNIQVELAVQEGLAPVLGDHYAISNALMNLCVNAMDAMPQGGTITLGTRARPAGGVDLFVRDTGQGMSPEVVARATEPFFTTKPAGKGTGLGLAQVYGMMRSHGGTVEIRSELGVGTEVVLAFPLPSA